METISFLEDHISQIPALQMLQKLWYKYLTPDEALEFRGWKTSQVILESVLRKQLHKINKLSISSTKTSAFSDWNIEKGILFPRKEIRTIQLQEGIVQI